MTKEQELVKYLKSKKDLRKILIIIKNKYESFGKFLGKIKKEKLSRAEKSALSEITGENYEIGKKTILIENIIKSFNNMNFSNDNFKLALEIYFNENIIYKKDKMENYEKQREKFFVDLYEWYAETVGGEFLKFLIEGNKGNNILIKEYNKFEKENNLNEFEIIIERIIKGLNNLPIIKKEYKLLAIFASDISKDPHFFDNKNFAGKLLLYGISYYLNKKYPTNAEERIEMYIEAGIITDDISNSVAISGLEAEIAKGRHTGWREFYNNGEYFIMPMTGITKLKKIISNYNYLIIVENPAVFIEIFNYFKVEYNIIIPMICGYGNIKSSALFLMDLAVKSDIKLIYSGDLDPEGLIIADKLKKRYNKNIKLIGYNRENYIKNLSDEKIKDTSMKKLNKIEDLELKKISEILKEVGGKSFQEKFINVIIKDVMNILKID
ncbi:TIGR02679 domain-containing protein [Haliovirga abyssi]|uniref:TIGR02679 family protein n=1 Tax=Haliovirga abyssi TaxID=2996794 RepID=A0AAU9D5X7_9FUSO|nr:TIGR02679 domain-containing protein [Haliovirga abyssi]BDU51476.1 hypothetical protein HLVA_20450 [Haliovirga abyssi]